MALELRIKGEPVTEPVGWRDIQLKAAFGSNSNQPSIESDRMELVLDASTKVRNHVQTGGIFEELPAEMDFEGLRILSGFIDTAEEYEEVNVSFGAGNEQPTTVLAKFKKDDSIQYFTEKIKGVSYGLLYEEGFITKQDFTTIKTVIRKRTNFTEVAIALITIYLLSKQIDDTVEKLKQTIADISFKYSASVTSSVSATVYSIALAVIQAAYVVALFALLSKLITQVIQLIAPPKVKNKGIKFRTLLERACEYFGYTFESDIEELDLYHYLPSKAYDNSKSLTQEVKDFFVPIPTANKIGIPSTADYGYLISEMFELCTNLFNGVTNIQDGRVMFYHERNPIWYTLSTYKAPINFKFETKSYNTEALAQTFLYSFITDASDEWTIENYTGTSYEVKTETGSGKTGTIKGLKRVDIPLCLPNSKTKLNLIEQMALTLAKVADALTSALGRQSGFAASFQQDFNNILMVSDNQFSVPKIVPLRGGNIPRNHRELLSAKTLYNKYYYNTSFVTGEKLGQKVNYNDLTIPFNVNDLQETIKSGVFILPDGREAKFKEISYILGRDTAEVSVEVNEVYAENLKEVYYEP
jgi:hypothetical protein